jgi:hypothetical protein
MTMELLTKAQLQIINRRNNLGYPLDAAEKDYFLALVTKMIYESPLRDKLVFKGGTALHHTYLPQLRFSEDLDFTATSAVTLEEIGGLLAVHDFLELKESFVSDFTVKINRLVQPGQDVLLAQRDRRPPAKGRAGRAERQDFCALQRPRTDLGQRNVQSLGDDLHEATGPAGTLVVHHEVGDLAHRTDPDTLAVLPADVEDGGDPPGTFVPGGRVFRRYH